MADIRAVALSSSHRQNLGQMTCMLGTYTCQMESKDQGQDTPHKIKVFHRGSWLERTQTSSACRKDLEGRGLDYSSLSRLGSGLQIPSLKPKSKRGNLSEWMAIPGLHVHLRTHTPSGFTDAAKTTNRAGMSIAAMLQLSGSALNRGRDYIGHGESKLASLTYATRSAVLTSRAQQANQNCAHSVPCHNLVPGQYPDCQGTSFSWRTTPAAACDSKVTSRFVSCANDGGCRCAG